MNDELVNELVEVLIKALILVIPVLFAVLTRYTVKFLNKKSEEIAVNINTSNNQLLIDVTDLVVLAAEQMSTLNTSAKRFAYAKMQLQSVAAGFGIELSDRDAIQLIEGTLGAINNQLPYFPPVELDFTLEDSSDDNGAGVQG